MYMFSGFAVIAAVFQLVLFGFAIFLAVLVVRFLLLSIEALKIYIAKNKY